MDAIKAASAWTAAGLTWSEIAAAAAALYTVLLIVDHVWKRYLRPWYWRRTYGHPHPKDTKPGDLQ